MKRNFFNKPYTTTNMPTNLHSILKKISEENGIGMIRLMESLIYIAIKIVFPEYSTPEDNVIPLLKEKADKC